MEPREVDNVAVVQHSQPTQNWWEQLCNRVQQMTEWERRYFFATWVLLVLVVISVIALILIPGATTYCLSDACIRTAAQIRENMNSSADPCTDFYEFACGGWKDIGGEEEDNWSRRVRRYTTRLGADLLSQNNSETEFEAVKKARRLYRSCMATDVLEELGLEPLLDLLERAGLPRGVPNRNTAANFDLSRTLAMVYRTLGLPVLMKVVRQNKNTFRVYGKSISIKQTRSLPILKAIDDWVKREEKNRTDLLFSDTFKDDWQAFDRDINHLVENMDALSWGVFSESSDFEALSAPPKMSKWKLLAPNLTTEIYNGTVPQNASNTLYYEVYMETLLEGRSEVNWTLKNGTLLLVNPRYHRFILSTLKDFSPYKIQMLIWMEVVIHYGAQTTNDFRRLLTSRLSGLRSQASRSVACADIVKSHMPLAVEHLFARVDPMKDVTKKVTAMAKELQKSQIELVQKAEWMDPTGMKNIVKYLEDVKIARVGYIDWVTEGRDLDEFYADVKIRDGRLLHTMADIQAWQLEANLVVSPLIGRLRSDVVPSTAYYSNFMNTVNVRPVIMRYPFLSLGLEAMDYGAMGRILGHELGHVLDSSSLERNDYFSLDTPAIAKINSFFRCTKHRILDLSNMFNASVNPEYSMSEDISDITGTKLALYTFKKIRRGPEPCLPGLEHFTHDQLFFLVLANTWCTNDKRRSTNAEKHNRKWLRILNAASNSPEFAEIWKCPPDSPMNPKDKCTLW